MIPASGRCRYHPDRMGIGVCVECRGVICGECSTQFEGINRCAECLRARRAALQTLRMRTSWTVGNVAIAAVLAGAVFGLVRLTAFILEP